MDRRHPRKPPTRPLVLIVDGQQDTWELYAVALPPPGFDVMAVDDSAEACSRAARPTVSLVRRSVELREKLYRRGQRAHREQWDYYTCVRACGTFQYRQRTRRVRRLN